TLAQRAELFRRHAADYGIANSHRHVAMDAAVKYSQFAEAVTGRQYRVENRRAVIHDVRQTDVPRDHKIKVLRLFFLQIHNLVVRIGSARQRSGQSAPCFVARSRKFRRSFEHDVLRSETAQTNGRKCKFGKRTLSQFIPDVVTRTGDMTAIGWSKKES